MIEIHGFRECPFAWRVRLVATEKSLPAEWITTDDPRSSEHNAEGKSPKLWEDGYGLIESLVIAQYLDESKPGRALQPSDPRARAAMRLRLEQIAGKLTFHYQPNEPVDDKTRKRLSAAFAALQDALGEHPWLGGEEPDLSDLAIWPFVHYASLARLDPPGAYLERIHARPSFQATVPR